MLPLSISSGNISHACSSLEKPGLSTRPSVVRSQVLTVRKLTSSSRQAGFVMSCAKTPETTVSSKSDAPLDSRSRGLLENLALRTTFPSSFEVGDFEMHLKRNVGSINALVPIAPPVPYEPMDQSAPAIPPPPARKLRRPVSLQVPPQQ